MTSRYREFCLTAAEPITPPTAFDESCLAGKTEGLEAVSANSCDPAPCIIIGEYLLRSVDNHVHYLPIADHPMPVRMTDARQEAGGLDGPPSIYPEGFSKKFVTFLHPRMD